MTENISIMIKPASSKCNLKCSYCFYHSVAEKRRVSDYGFMKYETLEEIVKKAINFSNGGRCSINFQGGEPTLIGLDFYKKLIDYANNYNVNGTKISYAIQTNGTIINDEWAQFFKKNNFLVGVSLDGTKEVHNSYRISNDGRSTFNKVMKSISILKKYEVPFNILTVVTPSLCRRITSVYNFFKKNQLSYLQFIPCIEPLNETWGKRQYSLKPEEFGEFLKRLFDLWYEDIMSNEFISIRYFDNILGLFLKYEYEACDMKGVCSCQNIIEADGSVYPCDFYTYDEYKIGNIYKNTFDEIYNSSKTEAFVRSSLNIDTECLNCKYRNICRGGCKRYRAENNLNYFCSAYKEFFDDTLEKFQDIIFYLNKKENRKFGK